MPTESVRVVSAVQDLGVYIDTDISMKTHVTNVIRACFSALCRSTAYGSLLLSMPCSHWSNHQSSPSWTSATQFMQVLLSICRTDCSPCTRLRCFENCTGYASQIKSSSSCVFWHTTMCMPQHRCIWLTDCG